MNLSPFLQIKNVIEQMNPLFKTGQVINIKDFNDFFFVKLHQELYRSKNSNQNIGLLEPYNQQIH